MMPVTAQSRFEGAFKILRFNTRFYVASAVSVCVGLLLLHSHRIRVWARAAVLCALVSIVFWTVSSILVSWYVYDYAGVTRWRWMQDRLQLAPQRWANIHAGLDESTATLRQMFPGTEGMVIDIYDSAKMTEPSIARARRLYPSTEPFDIGRADALPIPDADQDVIFLLFAAHELRDPEDRTRLFREACRVLKSKGRVVLVEHLRDLPNLLAFGPGCLHFHTARSWRTSIQNAGFKIEREGRLTPFVHYYFLGRKVA